MTGAFLNPKLSEIGILFFTMIVVEFSSGVVAVLLLSQSVFGIGLELPNWGNLRIRVVYLHRSTCLPKEGASQPKHYKPTQDVSAVLMLCMSNWHLRVSDVQAEVADGVGYDIPRPVLLK